MTLRDLQRRMDRLSDQLGLTTISPTIMQAMVDLHRRAGTLPNEAHADADDAAPSAARNETEQPAPLRCTNGQDVTVPLESMHQTQPGE